jgi:hypothetical protein
MGKAAEPLTISRVALQPARAAAMPVEMQMRLSELKSSQPTFHCDMKVSTQSRALVLVFE